MGGELIGGKFTVTNRATPDQKRKVTVDKNVEIANYKGNMPNNGLKVKIQDGKTTITGKTSDGRHTKNATADIASYKYTIFEKTIGLDGNANNLSEKDLSLLSNEMDGVKQVRRDKEAGVTTIVFDNGEILKFDFETGAEKEIRVKQEQETKKAEAETKKQKQKEAEENATKLDPRSSIEKFISWLLN